MGRLRRCLVGTMGPSHRLRSVRSRPPKRRPVRTAREWHYGAADRSWRPHVDPHRVLTHIVRPQRRNAGGEPPRSALRHARRRAGLLRADLRRAIAVSVDWRDLVAVVARAEPAGSDWPWSYSQLGGATDVSALVGAADAVHTTAWRLSSRRRGAPQRRLFAPLFWHAPPGPLEQRRDPTAWRPPCGRPGAVPPPGLGTSTHWPRARPRL